ncbi:MAG: tetraacyldisaccharide 4'-kinase [Lentisphaeria bacterium]
MIGIRDNLEKLEQYVVEIINGKKRDGFARIFRYFLFFLSRLYRNAVQFRLSLYNTSILRQRVLGCFVVSVGNLTTGGTGKTPLVEMLARTLAERGKRVAILSRGYRSKPGPLWHRIKSLFSGNPEVVPPRFVSDGNRVLLDSSQAGDEPFMLARNLLGRNGRPGVMVVVDKDRYKGGTFATRRGADIMILDDGFQHLRLRPWTNILVVDSTNPFHNHEMLPCGMLREPIKNLRRADYIFLTKCNNGEHLRHLHRFLKRHNSQAKIIECNHVPCYLEQVDDPEKVLPISALAGRRLAALSAIAVPESFESDLEALGGELVYRKHFADHHRYHEQELLVFCKKARKAGAEFLLTTEKDAVRLPKLPMEIAPFLFLRVEIKILRGQEHFETCVSQICLGR